MSTETSFDFSMKSVPEEWHEAAEEAPEPDNRPLQKKRTLSVLPTGEAADMMTASIAVLAMSFVCGLSWYMVETEGVTASPWMAVGLGAMIALAVRLGGGPAEPELRAVMAAVCYLLTVLITVYFIERFDYRITYGSNPSLAASQSDLVRDRLKDPAIALSWVAGLVMAMQVSYMTSRRRR